MNLRLLTARTVVCDTTIPRYLAQVGHAHTLRDLLADRGLMPSRVRWELDQARRHGVSAVQGLLRPPPFAELVNFDDERDLVAIEDLRLALVRGAEDATKHLGEAQAIILAQRSQGSVLLMEDGDGCRAAEGRGIGVFQSIHLCMVLAITGRMTPEGAWDLYARMRGLGMRPRDPDRWKDPDNRQEFLDVVARLTPRRAAPG